MSGCLVGGRQTTSTGCRASVLASTSLHTPFDHHKFAALTTLPTVTVSRTISEYSTVAYESVLNLVISSISCKILRQQ